MGLSHNEYIMAQPNIRKFWKRLRQQASSQNILTAASSSQVKIKIARELWEDIGIYIKAGEQGSPSLYIAVEYKQSMQDLGFY